MSAMGMNKSAGIVGVLTIGTFAVIGSIALFICISTAAPMVIGSFLNHLENVNKSANVNVEAKAAYEQKYFKVVCPDYFNASFVTKKIGLNELAWCEGYKDRM